MLTYRFWKNRYSWWPPAEAGYPHSLSCTRGPQAARDRQPQRSRRHGLSAGQRSPSLPSPPQSPGLRADFSGSRGKGKFPALATSPAGTDSLRGDGPCPVPSASGLRGKWRPPFRSPSPLRHDPHSTRRRGSPAGPETWWERSLTPPGQGETVCNEAQLRSRGSSAPPGPCTEAAGAAQGFAGGGGGARSCQAAPRGCGGSRGSLRAGAVSAAPCEGQRRARRGGAEVSQKRPVKHRKEELLEK